MFDIGWSELLIVGVVALIVVGPKDLPKMFRTLGQVTGKLRGMAREFTRAMESAADETGVKDVARTFRDTASGRSLRDAAGLDELTRDLRDMERSMTSGLTGDAPAVRPAAPPASPPPAAAAPVTPAPDLASRNAAASETEAARLARAERAAAARLQAAEIRARREAEGPQPPVPPAPPQS
jgi:sec-independent protein translocase protein TatB